MPTLKAVQVLFDYFGEFAFEGTGRCSGKCLNGDIFCNCMSKCEKIAKGVDLKRVDGYSFITTCRNVK